MSTVTDKQRTEIKRKAESNAPLQSSTPEKDALYKQYQQQYTQMVTQKARNGERLQSPNAYKDDLYAQATKKLIPSDPAYYQSNNIMGRQMEGADAQMQAMQRMLEQMGGSQMQSQEAMLGQARDAQILELQKALEDAVADGQISVREAEAQFEAQKGQIEQQAYVDNERTSLVSQDRGIQNSAQMVGLMQGDQARKNSMLNQNMSDRDLRINSVRDRLNAVKNKASLDIANANANYGYGMANAQGQVDTQKLQTMMQMQMQNYEMNRSQQFALDQAGMGQRQQMELMGKQNQYDLQKMDKQQRYALEQMAKSFGYDLQKMDVQQQQQFAQMAQAFGYDMTKMQQGFDYDMGLQASRQNHDLDMYYRQQADAVAQMQMEMEQELASYTDTNSTAYKLRQQQLQSSIDAVQYEYQAKMLAETMGQSFTAHMGAFPEHPGKNASKKKVDEYNKKVEAYNTKLANYMSNPTNYQTFINGANPATYNGGGSGGNNFMDYLKGIFGVPGSSRVGDAVRP